MEHVDTVVIGSGQGGVPLATALAGDGQRVVLFERGAWGGSCLNYGCTPSKMLLASAHAAANARRASDLGINAKVSVDFPAVMRRIREVTSSWSGSTHERLTSGGVLAVEAEARFAGERLVEGGERQFEADRVIIDTGTSPRVPGIPGLSRVAYLTYETIWQLEQLPRQTVVVGAGPVGLELGQALARLGSQVVLIEVGTHLLSHEDPEVGATLQEALEDDGAEFHLGAHVEAIEGADDGVVVRLADGGACRGDALFMATGREPNTAALNAAASGIELDSHGFVKVDEHFRTTCDGVYAIGDVTGQPGFTHVSWEDYRRLYGIFHGEDRWQMDRVLGYAYFTAPQVGRAGLTLQQALDQGYEARAETLPLESIARATEIGRTEGFYRMVIDSDTDEILGATLVGPDTAELIHVFIAHMESGSPWQRLDRSVHIHPTFAEGLPSLARLFEKG